MHREHFIIRVTPKRSRVIRHCAILILIVLTVAEARAQTSGSVSLVSDYTFRGVSLSEGHVVPQINLGYDSPDGWYAGGSVSKVETYTHNNDTQGIEYAGYSRQLPSGLSWEAGATHASFLRDEHYGYSEIFAGLASDNFSGRIYFSPDYYSQNVHTLYAEINGTYELRDRVHLIGHVGFLHFLTNMGGPATTLTRSYDTRFGVSAGLGDWTCQLAWITAEKNHAYYPQYNDRNPSALVLSALYAF